MIDTNRSYCLRLAEIAFPKLGSKPVSLALSDIPKQPSTDCSRQPPPPAIQTLGEELSRLFREDAATPVPCIGSVAALAAALEMRPDIQSKLAVITQYTPSKWLLERELEAGGFWPGAEDPESRGKPDAYDAARIRSATGLCFSGGGIRSATFNLGILQALARRKAIGKLDYLSSVSGGGYIHQFLANWIYRAGSVLDIESMLDPIPNEPTFSFGPQATVQPEPLRWLRRYSNYLAPRKGVLSLDTWTIAATWIRNTALNFVVLLSSIFFVLLLPHLSLLPFQTFTLPLWLHTLVRGIVASIFVVVVGFLCYWLAKRDPPGPKPQYIKLACASLFGAAILVSPNVYRSSIPGQGSSSASAQRVFHASFESAEPHDRSLSKQKASNPQPVSTASDASQTQPVSRLTAQWRARPGPLWSHLKKQGVSSIPILLFVTLCAGLLLAVLSASRLHVVVCAVIFLLGFPFAYLLLDGIRLLFFVSCFAVPLSVIPRLGAAILPMLLFGVPFVLMEAGLGIVGRSADSGQREWLARLRAFSFLLGGSWLGLVSVSLLGPYVFQALSRYAIASYTVWGGWLLTTVSGTLSAHSNRTESEGNSSLDDPTKSKLFLELMANVAPPVFITGLLVLIATFVQWAIRVDHGTPQQYQNRFLILFFVSVATALLFGWRVDVNDFSMHAFYRDRIARCYAGATDPRRIANLFTGFTRADRSLRMHQLLPKSFRVLDENSQPVLDKNGQAISGSYAGPFPLFCTSINLTTGEDLAYQERKAASFAFTPLFSGYNVGWTSASRPQNQFNGFVDTCGYAYSNTGSITTATASAISGAAASPNMGYHSNPAVAFLLTVFNVRLGWWILNPRKRSIGSTSAYPVQPDPGATSWRRLFPMRQGSLPSSPRFGMFNLISELFGHSDDTSDFVYLTDGGHFDNMGLYELLRRRCRSIIVCDCESDPKLQFEGIGMAIRKARLDFGIEVTLDQTEPVQPRPGTEAAGHASTSAQPPDPNAPSDPAAPSTEALMQQSNSSSYVLNAKGASSDPSGVTGTLSHRGAPMMAGLASFGEFPANSVHCVHGTIRYPEDSDPSQYGHILYIKSSLTGDEPPDLLNYRRQHQSFPNDTTLNQFFGESEFESYRRLGEHILLSDRTAISWLKTYLMRR